MRLLPLSNPAPPPEEDPQEVSVLEIDASDLEEQGEQTLYDRLRDVATSAAPEHMRAVNSAKNLLPQHIPILLLRVQGFRSAEIASMLGITPATVYRVLNSQPGRAMLLKLYAEAGLAVADAGRAFLEAAPMAADVVIELAQEGNKEETRLKAAFSILDRAGYGATKKTEAKHTVEVNATVSTKELDELRTALREAIEIEADFEVVVQDAPEDAEDAA